MAEQTLDFWPDLATARPKLTPLSMMKQQAALLGRHTSNLLEGFVLTGSGPGGTIVHRFIIRVPTLEYRYELFMVSHNIVDFYPVRVESGPHQMAYRDDRPLLRTEEDFLQWLKTVLSSDITKRVLGSLLAQIES
jgi:hypothetical protein